MNLNNINCVVTGASSGIGRELSLILAAKGCTVVAIARDEARLDNLASEVKDLKGTILPVSFDLQNESNFSQLRMLIESKVKVVDLLVNNAALGHYSEFSTQKTEEILRVIKTTLIAPILVTSVCLPLMRNQSSAVAFISSLAGKMGFPNLSTYSAAKHGIEGFVDSLMQENNNRIFVFRPGVTETNFFKNSGMEDFEKEAKEKDSMKSAHEVAQELVAALEKDNYEHTVGNDKFLLPLLPMVPRPMRFQILNFLNRLTKVFN